MKENNLNKRVLELLRKIEFSEWSPIWQENVTCPECKMTNEHHPQCELKAVIRELDELEGETHEQ